MFVKTQTCMTCPFFSPAKDEQSDEIKQGECRARPPVSHILVIPGVNQGRVMGINQPAVIGQTVFPTVAVDCWCGWHPERKGAMFG